MADSDAHVPPGNAINSLEAAEEQRRREQRGIIQELAHETAAARSQNAAARESRAASASAQREALKASFVARLRAAKQRPAGQPGEQTNV